MDSESEVNAVGELQMWQTLSVHTTLTQPKCANKNQGACAHYLYVGECFRMEHIQLVYDEGKSIVRRYWSTQDQVIQKASLQHQHVLTPKASPQKSPQKHGGSSPLDLICKRMCMHVHVHACEGMCGHYGEAHATVSMDQAEEWVSSLHLYVDSRD